MTRYLVFLLTGAVGLLRGQATCPPTPTFSSCDMVFELDANEGKAHAQPYVSVQLQAEFRSPRHRTLLMPGFWDGGRRLVIRFAPTEPGEWTYKVSSNVTRWDNQEGKLTATASEAPGFITPANLHHWKYADSNRPHLWMGDTSYLFAFLDDAAFEQMAAKRAEQKFTHLRGLALGYAEQMKTVYPQPDAPNLDHFRKLDARVKALNQKGLVVDLILAPKNVLRQAMPKPEQRERYLRYIAARYAPMNVTWQLMEEFEAERDSRELLKEMGTALKRLDPYQHPRSTDAQVTSSPLYADGWMNYIVYKSSDDAVGTVEHQQYPTPFVNAAFGTEDSGAGKSAPDSVDSDTFRHRLWNSTMNGQYPAYGNTGTYGGKPSIDAKYLDSPGVKAMGAWWELISNARHWELEPYFDLDGARAVALEGVEYIVYLEKPTGPVEINIARHNYDVRWIDPATGEVTPLKDFKGEKLTIEPPNTQHDWVLHISRESTKVSMLKSYRFDSREEVPLQMQEAEQGAKQTPFEIAEPAAEELKVGQALPYSVKLKKATRGTRSAYYLWTGDITADGQGFRVLGTGEKGTMKIPPDLLRSQPAVVNLRLAIVNAFGKLYQVDRIYRVSQ